MGLCICLQEQNASGLGHAYAGGAAAAEDVSTIFYNPAGLVRLTKTQAVIAANLICLSAKFRDNASQAAALQTLGGTGGDAGDCAVVPNLYIGVPFTDKWSFGLGINAPFGLKTEYDSTWLGRFQAIESKIETININPVLSWEPTKNLTVGGGFSWQRVKATLTENVNYAGLFATQGVAQAVAAGLVPPAAAPILIGSAAGLQTSAKVDGNDNSWGWNIGALWQASEQTRIGAAYRSKVDYTIGGTANFSNPTAASLGPLPTPLQPAGALIVAGTRGSVGALQTKRPILMGAAATTSFPIKFPTPLTCRSSSVQQPVTDGRRPVDRLELHSGADGRSQHRRGVVELAENFAAPGAPPPAPTIATATSGSPRRRTDQSPVNDQDRTPLDNDRTRLALGVQYKSRPPGPSISPTRTSAKTGEHQPGARAAARYGPINGRAANVNIVGVQLTIPGWYRRAAWMIPRAVLTPTRALNGEVYPHALALPPASRSCDRPPDRRDARLLAFLRLPPASSKS
jgi:hypothetical protein